MNSNAKFEKREGYIMKKIGKFCDYVTDKVGATAWADVKKPQRRKIALKWFYSGSETSNAEVFDTDTYLYSRFKELPKENWDAMEETKRNYFTDKKEGLKHLFTVLGNIEKNVMLNSLDNSFSQQADGYYS